MSAAERTGWRDAALSLRHRTWGQDCPAVDLDFLMCEFNPGVPVALIDYKHHQAVSANTNRRVIDALSGFYNKRGEQLPFYVVRYWPDIWAFQVFPENVVAYEQLPPGTSMMTEQQFVRFLYKLRKDVLTFGDERHISRCNSALPRPEEVA